MLMSDAPPWVMNGSGIPVIGMIPMTIPTLMTSWNRSIEATPEAIPSPNGSCDRQAVSRIRQISARNKPKTRIAPTKPSSSDSRAHTKSVVWTGRKSSWFWVPLVRPLPSSPPEPTAIWPWMSWYPEPWGSAAGSRKLSSRCFW